LFKVFNSKNYSFMGLKKVFNMSDVFIIIKYI
jgi:hypothetical protein